MRNRNYARYQPQGFTLLELLITVAIIGILASIAVPNYSEYVVRARIGEATNNLVDMRTRTERYFQDKRTYVGANCTTPTNPTSHFTFTCSTLTASQYAIKATGNGAMSNFEFTVDQSNARATTSVPTGWASNSTCWVLRKGGIC